MTAEQTDDKKAQMGLLLDFILSVWHAGIRYEDYEKAMSKVQGKNTTSPFELLMNIYDTLGFEEHLKEKKLKGSRAEAVYIGVKEAYFASLASQPGDKDSKKEN